MTAARSGRAARHPSTPHPHPHDVRARSIPWRALGLALCALIGLSSLAFAAGDRIDVLEVRGPITPAIAGYLERGIDQAEREGAAAVIVQVDTPGGLDNSTRKIMQRFIASKVPIIVYVYPRGGRAASAGLFITQAAHVAVMAPDTNIGSAHPVQMGGGPAPDQTMTAKIENDAAAILRSVTLTRGRNAEWVERAVRESVNVTAREALELRVVDLVADDYPSLLSQLDGRTVQLDGGQKITLQTASAPLSRTDMTFAERLIQTISDPNIAYLLLTVGLYGLIYELANPGTWLPGVIGATALIVALYALGTLPVNWAGVALIALAFGLFLADILVTSGHGGLTAAGILTLLLGSAFLFSGGDPAFQLSPITIGVVVLATAGFFTFIVGAVYRSLRLRPTVGREDMLGRTATVARDLAPVGMVELLGEQWRAELIETAAAGVSRGDLVTVVGIVGLTLKVRPAPRL